VYGFVVVSLVAERRPSLNDLRKRAREMFVDTVGYLISPTVVRNGRHHAEAFGGTQLCSNATA